MTEKLDWEDVKAAFLNLSDADWKMLIKSGYQDFIEVVLDLESQDFFGTEGMNNRFS